MKWFKSHARALPWKQDRDPYKIWISEIILQQTRVAQGLPYYLNFLKAFPTLDSLARATEDQVMQVWKGLGYYSRARNLHETAQFINIERQGVFPQSYDQLIQLKGIGPYTAAAIASFAFGECKAVVDGNVIRVLSRIFGIDNPYDQAAGKKQFYSLANELIDPEDPAAFNQAMMDFGATVCTPKNPNCMACPFSDQCIALLNDRVNLLPVKKKKIKRTKRFFHYFVFLLPQDKTLIKKRLHNDIWKGLYEFPMVEVNKQDFSNAEQYKFPATLEKSSRSFTKINLISTKKQLLTHQEISAAFYLLEAIEIPKLPPNEFYLVDYENLCKFAFPKIIDWFIAEN